MILFSCKKKLKINKIFLNKIRNIYFHKALIDLIFINFRKPILKLVTDKPISSLTN